MSEGRIEIDLTDAVREWIDNPGAVPPLTVWIDEFLATTLTCRVIDEEWRA